MKNKIFNFKYIFGVPRWYFLIAFLFFILLSHSPVFASDIYNQNFDSLTNGSISGQDSYVIESGTATIQSSVAYSGKAVMLDDSGTARVFRTYSTQSSSTIIFRFYRDDSTDHLEMSLINDVFEGMSMPIVQVRLGSDDKIYIYNGSDYVDTGLTYSVGVWNKIIFEYDSVLARCRVKINDGSFSSYVSDLPVYWGASKGFRFRFEGSNAGTSYVDDVYVGSGVNGVDYPSSEEPETSLFASVLVPTSTAPTIIQQINSQILDPGVLLLFALMAGIPFAFWLIKKLIALVPKK